MAGITYNKMNIRDWLRLDDAGYLYFSGSTCYINTSSGKLNIESPDGITLDGNTTLDTGHYFIFPNDGTAASGNYSGTPMSSTDLTGGPSGNAIGWIKVNVGSVVGYVPVYSGSAIA